LDIAIISVIRVHTVIMAGNLDIAVISVMMFHTAIMAGILDIAIMCVMRVHTVIMAGILDTANHLGFVPKVTVRKLDLFQSLSTNVSSFGARSLI